MGGAVAQLIWQRHPERVSGLVLCATWSRFFRTNRERGVLRTIGRLGTGTRLQGDEIRPASAVNVLGRIEGDATVLKQVRSGSKVRVERA